MCHIIPDMTWTCTLPFLTMSCFFANGPCSLSMLMTSAVALPDQRPILTESHQLGGGRFHDIYLGIPVVIVVSKKCPKRLAVSVDVVCGSTRHSRNLAERSLQLLILILYSHCAHRLKPMFGPHGRRTRVTLVRGKSKATLDAFSAAGAGVSGRE